MLLPAFLLRATPVVVLVTTVVAKQLLPRQITRLVLATATMTTCRNVLSPLPVMVLASRLAYDVAHGDHTLGRA